MVIHCSNLNRNQFNERSWLSCFCWGCPRSFRWPMLREIYIHIYLRYDLIDWLRKSTRIATDTRESIRKRKLFLIWYDELMNGISPISCFCGPVEKWGLSGKRIVPRESEGVNLFRIDNMDFGNVVVLLHRSRSRSISIHGGKYLLARREDSSASYKLCSGRISLYFYKVVNGCIGSSTWCKKNNFIRIISV